MLQIIIANRLTDGLIVFRNAGGEWGTSVATAVLLTTKEEAALALDGAKADTAANLVVDAEAIDVRDGPGGIAPLALRDRIRVSGPTILQDKAPAAAASKGGETDVSI